MNLKDRIFKYLDAEFCKDRKAFDKEHTDTANVMQSTSLAEEAIWAFDLDGEDEEAAYDIATDWVIEITKRLTITNKPRIMQHWIQTVYLLINISPDPSGFTEEFMGVCETFEMAYGQCWLGALEAHRHTIEHKYEPGGVPITKPGDIAVYLEADYQCYLPKGYRIDVVSFDQFEELFPEEAQLFLAGDDELPF